MTIGNMMAQHITISQNCEVWASFDNGYAYVYLGLPSGLKWATCNVGAANPWDYGDYFAWGETVGYGKSDPSNAHNYAYTGNTSYLKIYYDCATYKWCSGTSRGTLTKYNTKSNYGSVVDNKTTLDLSDDAAAVNMGGSWRMPTYDEQKELKANCYWEWTDNYSGKGVAGYIVYKVKDASDKGKTKDSDNSVTTVGSYSLSDTHIFLPAAGHRYGSGLSDAVGGYYWSSSLDDMYPSNAVCLYFSSYDFDLHLDSNGRDIGQSVRAVFE